MQEVEEEGGGKGAAHNRLSNSQNTFGFKKIRGPKSGVRAVEKTQVKGKIRAQNFWRGILYNAVSARRITGSQRAKKRWFYELLKPRKQELEPVESR